MVMMILIGYAMMCVCCDVVVGCWYMYDCWCCNMCLTDLHNHEYVFMMLFICISVIDGCVGCVGGNDCCIVVLV